MVEIRNRIDKREFIKFLKSLGIDVHLNTKARGHQGFCTVKRIDISKNLEEEKVIDVLLHEFAHFVHFKLEPEIVKTDGTLEKIFHTKEQAELNKIEKELLQITQFVFDSTQIRRLKAVKENLAVKIKAERDLIRSKYPKYQTGKKFQEFEKYIRHTNAKYLLKYDRVLIKGGWFNHDTTISIKTIDLDFPRMPKEFCAYIKMKSYERHRQRINSRLSKINRYLNNPTELFARFFQFYCEDKEAAEKFAPTATTRFKNLLSKKYYPFLNEFFTNIVKTE